MRLQLIVELLLVFLLLAFAAWGRVIDSKSTRGALSHRKGGKVNTKNRQNTANKYCSCSSSICNCCRDFALPVVNLKGPGCASLQYLKGDRMAISMSFGDRVLTNTTISGRKPKPVCMPLPGGISKFCGRVYNIGRKGEDFNACLGLELRALKDVEASLRVSCFKFGPQGLKVEPAQPLPTIQGGGDDDDDDEDDDIEDEFDFDDEDDDAEEDDNDVEAVDYEGFSVFGDDFLDGFFESGSSGNKKKPVNKKTLQSTTAKAPLRRVTNKPANTPPKRENIPLKSITTTTTKATTKGTNKTTPKITRATTTSTTTTTTTATTPVLTTPTPTTLALTTATPSTPKPTTTKITTVSSTTPFIPTHPLPIRYTLQYTPRPYAQLRPDVNLNTVAADLHSPSIPSSPQDSIAALAAMLQDSPGGVIPQAAPVQVELARPVQTHGVIVPATVFVTSAPLTVPTTQEIMTEEPIVQTSQETTILEDTTEPVTVNMFKPEATTFAEKMQSTEFAPTNIDDDEDERTEEPVPSFIVQNDDDDDDESEDDESSTPATTVKDDEKEPKDVLGDLVETMMDTITGEDSDSSEATTSKIAIAGGNKDDDDDDDDEDEADDDDGDDDDEENEDDKDDDDKDDDEDDDDDDEARKARRKSRTNRKSKDMWLARLHW